MGKPLKRLSISIADLIISVKSRIDLRRFSDVDFYEDFITGDDAACQCDLDLKVKYPPFFASANNPLFNPGGNWQVSQLDGMKVLHVGPLSKKGRSEEAVIFNEDYSKGTMYKKHKFGLFRRLIDQFIMMNLLSRKQGFLAHASGLIWQDKGLSFIGPSRVGKSTMIRLFDKEVKKEDLLCDDRVAIRNLGNKWYLFGTPWHGELSVYSSKKAELKALFFIRHSLHNYIKEMPAVQVYSQLVKNSLLPFWEEGAMAMALDAFNRLVTDNIPAFEVGFLPDERIVNLIKEVVE